MWQAVQVAARRLKMAGERGAIAACFRSSVANVGETHTLLDADKIEGSRVEWLDGAGGVGSNAATS